MSQSGLRNIWIHCNECGHETEHVPLHKAKKSRISDADRYSVEWGSTWTILQCGGCKEVTMRRTDWCSEDDPQDGPGAPTFFPPRVSRRQPGWLGEYESSASRGMLEEVYTALHADSRRLAMMGLRALIDEFINTTVGDQGNFAKGLDALVSNEFIARREREIIEAAVEAGHAAMHRGHQPTAEDVNVVIDIVERMIHAKVLQAKAKVLAAATPSRKRVRAKKV